MAFWQIFLLVNIGAALFLVWPTLFLAKKYRQELRSNTHTDSNEDVYQDHFRELEQTMVRGEIDQEELQGLKRDLERTMVEENHMGLDMSDKPIISSFKSRIPVLALVVFLPMLSLVLYSFLGAKDDWEIYQLARERVTADVSEVPELSAKLIDSLQARVQEKPENAQNWYLLASTAIEQGLFEEGVRAYRAVLDLEPDAPAIKAELAQALFLRAGNTITSEVRQYINESLAQAPNLPTALGLAGIDAFRSGRYQDAMGYWQKALIQLDPNSEAAKALQGGISQATLALAATGGDEVEKKKKVVSLSVKVSLGKGVSVKPDDTVFIYARAWQGPPMPLAIRKIKASELPTRVVLDSTMSMMQGMDLAAFPQVEVIARVSSSGSATPQPGDWQVKQGPVIVSSQKDAIKLVVKEQIPSQ